MSGFDFYKQDDERLVATKKLDVLIDNELFKSNIAYDIDTDIVSLGIFKFRVYTDSKDLSKTKIYNCNLPVMIKINANERRHENDYTVLSFEPNDIIVTKSIFFKDAKNANKFMNWLISGKIDVGNIENLIMIFKQILLMNGLRLPVQSTLIEAMLSEQIRWKENLHIPFRIVSGEKGIKDTDYKIVSIKEVARLSSVFNAISFEDIKKAYQASISMTRNNTPQNPSPLEAVLYY